MTDLSGRVVIVTGASSGIGAATSVALAKAGAKVVLAARRRDRLEANAEAIRQAGGEAWAIPIDVTDPVAVQELVARTLERWTRIDVLVNNAARGLVAPLEQTTLDELQELWELNVVAVWRLTQAVLPVMRRQRAGHIINISSIAGRRGTPWRSAYCATKFAVHGLTESLRQELRGTGIHVTVATLVDSPTEFHTVEVHKIPAPRYGLSQPVEDVARAIVRCARHPRAELYPSPLAKGLAALAVLAPSVVDWLAVRAARRERASSVNSDVPITIEHGTR